MKTASTTAVLALLLVFTTGCRHKTKIVLPLHTQAPPVSAPPATSTPPPQLPQPASPQVQLEKTPAPAPKPKPKRKRHKGAKPEEQSPSETAAPTPTPPPTAEASTQNSPIGQLTTSGDTASHQNKQEVAALLDSTEKSLDGIKRSLSAEEQVTAAQIRSFLSKARLALDQGDLDGAHTLGTKAKVLLDELTKK